MPIAHLGIAIRGRDDGILLGLDDQPAAVAVAAQDVDQRAKVDGAVAGHGERAVDHRFEEAPVAVARHPRSRPAARPCNGRGTRARRASSSIATGIAAGERHVPAVEQQADVVAGVLHQPVDVGRRLDVRAHVMVIREAHAVRRACAARTRHALAVLAPLRRRVTKRGRLYSGSRRALDAVGDFAVDHHLRAAFRRAARDAARRRRSPRRRCAARAAPSTSPTRSASPCARRAPRAAPPARAETCCRARSPGSRCAAPSASADVERRLAAERRQVVVAPRDRIDADAHVEAWLIVDALPCAWSTRHGRCCFVDRARSARAPRAPSRAATLRARRLPTTSRLLRSCASGSVSMQITYVRSAARARASAASSSAMFATFSASAPSARACAAKSIAGAPARPARNRRTGC